MLSEVFGRGGEDLVDGCAEPEAVLQLFFGFGDALLAVGLPVA